ncbi:MAG: SGNH/GDSL hydrolase family protein [Candidatus Eiseniibacteriota bacterium]
MKLSDAATFATSLLVALTAAEVGLRVADKFEPPKNPPECGYWDPRICEMYAPVEGYGYALRPSTTVTYDYPMTNPRRITVVSNRHGFRQSRELDAVGGAGDSDGVGDTGDADDRRRLLVLGDSFVFGEGVEESERFTDVMETMSPGWRVDNLGMTGWGPDLMLRALEEVGVALRPEAVLLCLYTHDFRRVHPLYAGVGFRIPRFELRGEGLVTVPYPPPRLSQKLRVLWAMSPSRLSYESPMWDVHAAILDRFRGLAARHDFALRVAFLPGRSDGDADRERREWLARYCAGHGIAFVDLTEPILSRPRDEVFIAGGNPHWSPTGHRFVAERLRGWVTGEIAP